MACSLTAVMLLVASVVATIVLSLFSIGYIQENASSQAKKFTGWTVAQSILCTLIAIAISIMYN